jgi:hypothetical protein
MKRSDVGDFFVRQPGFSWFLESDGSTGQVIAQMVWETRENNFL